MAGSDFNGSSSQSLHQRIKIPGSEPGVDLWDQAWHRPHVSLGKAAKDNQLADFTGLLPSGSLKDGLNGLFLGVTDKTTGVNEKDIDRGLTTFRHDLVDTVKPGEKTLGVHSVLRTT